MHQYLPALYIRRTCSALKLKHGKIIPSLLYWRTEAFLCKWRCGSNSPRKLWTRFYLADFFLVRAASLFMRQTFGAQINLRVISRKILFDTHRFLSNKSPIHFAGESGKGNMFLNGKWRVQNKNGHLSPWVPDLCPTTVKILTHLISHPRMRSSLVVRASDCQCTSCKGPGFDPSTQWNLRGGR